MIVNYFVILFIGRSGFVIQAKNHQIQVNSNRLEFGQDHNIDEKTFPEDIIKKFNLIFFKILSIFGPISCLFCGKTRLHNPNQ